LFPVEIHHKVDAI